MPRFTLPEGLLRADASYQQVVLQCALRCQESFNPDDYSRAVREVKTDFSEECLSPRRIRVCVQGYGRDELGTSLQRLSLCVYGGGAITHTISHGCRDSLVDSHTLPSSD